MEVACKDLDDPAINPPEGVPSKFYWGYVLGVGIGGRYLCGQERRVKVKGGSVRIETNFKTHILQIDPVDSACGRENNIYFIDIIMFY